MEQKLIYFFKGQLIDGNSSINCNVGIYSEYLKITTSAKEIINKYSAEDLRISGRIVAKRKFVIVYEKGLITLIINEEDVFKILVDVIELDKIISAVTKHKEVQISKRAQELKVQVPNKFKSEFMKNYDLLYLFFRHCKTDSDSILFESNQNETTFIRLIKEIYKDIDKSKLINESITNLTSREYLSTLTIFSDVPNETKTMILNAMKSSYDFSESYVYDYFESNNYHSDSHEYEDYTTRFITVIKIAISYIRVIILCRNKNDFTANKELNQMLLNLVEEGVDTKYISDKLYPIYYEFYSDTFEEKLSVRDFYSIISIINEESIIDSTILSCYKDEINNFNVKLIKYSAERSSNELNYKIIDQIRDFLFEIEKESFFEARWGENFYTRVDYILFYYYMLKYLLENVPGELFLELLYDKYSIIDLLYNSHSKRTLEQERKRLLEGDMTTEEKYLDDKYSFTNIESGYNFELYLENLFKRLGYNVETMPPGPDQGGDLLIKKNGRITVVQAKYYSSPVGNRAVQEVVSAISYYNGDVGMVVTNNRFTKSAIELADANGVELVDGNKLNKMRDALVDTQ